MPPISARDWTDGPAKWAAVGALGAASVFGIAWSVSSGRSPPSRAVVAAARPAPKPAPTPTPQPVAVPGEATIQTLSEATPADTEQVTEAVESEEVEPAVEDSLPSIERRININTAKAAELELLPGIGPALAKRILEYRETHGTFKSIEELDNVKGIGPKILERIRERVTLE